jgi:quercetin dioxygenase-like cupin family protein
MVNLFDLKNMSYDNYENRDKNVFSFKTRIVGLNPKQSIPKCDMKSFVRFYVLSGEVEVTKNNESTILKDGHLLITGPAILLMKTETGSKLLGIQICKNTGMV